MRAYSIVIKNPKTGEVIKPTSQKGVSNDSSYVSFANGVNLPGALNIEIDVPVSSFATPAGPGVFIKVWGVSLEEILQAHDLNGMHIQVYAGMRKGLPLAKPDQYGLIVEGSINKAFGNWVGLEMSIDLIVVADMGTAIDPKNIILNWAQGKTMKSALQTMFSTAFPDAKVTFAISDDLVAPESIVGYYSTMEQLAPDILRASKSIIKDKTYPGVKIFEQGGAFSVSDGTSPTTPTKLAFEDFIGQPTWIDQGTVQFKCVLRADIQVLDFVSFPKVLATQTEAGATPYGSDLKNKSTFSGTFQITEVHHYGNFRQPDAASWNTTFNATSAQKQVNSANAPIGA